MTRKYFIIILIILGSQLNSSAQKDDNLFTIYLVRHSEKNLAANNPSDSPLTECGEQRSEFLDNFLQDIAIEAIYSTDYARTKKTALPTAQSKELEIQEYSATDLECFSKVLIDRKQDALVVGHSYTTGVLAGLLVEEDIDDIDLDIYDRIYQVVFYKKAGRLHLLHSAFVCND
ncbi:MAG: broad specificity phosphatase PhoE [Saprospiraceae bacterium]|jgi:broad specificity phosphatase PhoE